ncbi:hypothetical protein LCGC14_1349240 [marine sediment metagenome]|uniref:Terminase large subunit gp17-like C-terminal domain-containing protein n=1 Tax=marine sediment metagenome TaxID=412755 RepID=A0A0F9KXF1_9ZZZZ
MTTKTRTKRTGLQKAMRELGARSFMDFLTMRWFDEELARERTIVQVALPPDPTALDGGGGLIDFEVWEHLEEVIELVGVERLLSFMKARQVGLTWVIAAYCLWLAMYHQASKVLIFSQGDKEAKAFLRRIHSIYDNLPEFMREPLGTDNTSEMEFPTMSSRIEALPSTEKAGRSETVSLIVQDEADFHEHIDVNFAAMKPTIDSGGQVIQISTVDKNKPLSLFKTIWRNAKEGINGWTARFYGWEVRPGRTQEWYDRVEREASILLKCPKSSIWNRSTREPGRRRCAHHESWLRSTSMCLTACSNLVESRLQLVKTAMSGSGRSGIQAADTVLAATRLRALAGIGLCWRSSISTPGS